MIKDKFEKYANMVRLTGTFCKTKEELLQDLVDIADKENIELKSKLEEVEAREAYALSVIEGDLRIGAEKCDEIAELKSKLENIRYLDRSRVWSILANRFNQCLEPNLISVRIEEKDINDIADNICQLAIKEDK